MSVKVACVLWQFACTLYSTFNWRYNIDLSSWQ